MYTIHLSIVKSRVRASGYHSENLEAICLYYHLHPDQVVFVGLHYQNDTPQLSLDLGVSLSSLAQNFRITSDGEPHAAFVLLIDYPPTSHRARVDGYVCWGLLVEHLPKS